MFLMMNGARVGVGLGAASMATAAYYVALDYSKTRRQGRKVSQKDLNFYHGKMFALRYFFGYELPKTLGLAERLKQADGLTVEMGAFFPASKR
jgi:alkylation response protein AidB-like acyl-CoA dehydrogenase